MGIEETMNKYGANLAYIYKGVNKPTELTSITTTEVAAIEVPLEVAVVEVEEKPVIVESEEAIPNWKSKRNKKLPYGLKEPETEVEPVSSETNPQE
jgi:hypothetical protein